LTDPILRCPRCAGPLRGWTCEECGAAVVLRRGIPDFAPHVVASDGKQRVMETRLFARIYETRLWRRLHTRLATGRSLDDEIAEVLSFARPPRRALDLACGTGPYARAIAARWPAAEVLGADLSVAMLARAQKVAGDRVRFLRADACRLPLPDGSAELVTCAGAYHLFPDPEAAAREIARVLAPGGVFAGMTLGRKEDAFQHVVERRLKIRFFEPDALAASFRAAGFSDVRTERRSGELLFGAVR
jgi:SAM-dependent methyltransferase